MGKIRVLQLISGIDVGRQSGGAEAHGLQVARLLDRARFQPAVFSMWRHGGAVETRWAESIASWDLPLHGMIPWPGTLRRGIQPLLRSLWQTVSVFQPHIISSHSERGDWLNSLIHLLHRRHPLAVRAVHIDLTWQSHPFIGAMLEKVLFPTTFSAEIAISQTILAQLKAQRRAQTHLRLIYNGVDEKLFVKQDDRPAMPADVRKERPCIGIVGRLTPQKGVSDLLQAVAILNQEQPINLLVIGDGPLREELEATAVRLGIKARTNFFGVRDDVLAILANLDIFVLPSYWEGFPTVILEAMSQNVPVIASDVSGSRELVQNGETGLLIPTGSPAQLAKAIRTLLDNPARGAQMATKARAFAAQFTYQNMTRRYEAVYQEVVDGFKKQSG
jgi:glycosyltransferase involved in cell wall biosynthesis